MKTKSTPALETSRLFEITRKPETTKALTQNVWGHHGCSCTLAEGYTASKKPNPRLVHSVGPGTFEMSPNMLSNSWSKTCAEERGTDFAWHNTMHSMHSTHSMHATHNSFALALAKMGWRPVLPPGPSQGIAQSARAHSRFVSTIHTAKHFEHFSLISSPLSGPWVN